MEFVRIEKNKAGKDVIVTIQKRLFFKDKELAFLCASATIPNKYWQWLTVPSLKMVDDRLSFQLDAWYRNYKTN